MYSSQVQAVQADTLWDMQGAFDDSTLRSVPPAVVLNAAVSTAKDDLRGEFVGVNVCAVGVGACTRVCGAKEDLCNGSLRWCTRVVCACVWCAHESDP